MASFIDASDFKDTDVIFKDGDDNGFEVETLSEIKFEADSRTVSVDHEDTNAVESADTKKPVDSENTTDPVNLEYTVEEAVDAMGFGWFQLRVACIVGFQWMADAFEIMLVSILSDKLRCEWRLYPWQQALITTFVFTGYFLGAPLWGLMGDKFGRRKTLAMSAFFIFYFGLLSSFSPNLIWMLILRGLLGFALGGANQAMIICAEFLPSKSRGLCLVCLDAFWVIGICLLIALAMVVMPTLGWRYLLVFSTFPLIIFLALIKFLPESVLYQQASGNWEGAMVTLEEISRINKKPLPPGKLQRKTELKPKGSVQELFSTKLMAISSVLLINLWALGIKTYDCGGGILLMGATIPSATMYQYHTLACTL